MEDMKMPVSVLENVSGDMFSGDLQKKAGLEPYKTFKVIFIPLDEVQEPPKRKVYSDEVVAIAKEAKRRSEEDKKAGVTREESFKEMKETMEKIGNHLRKTQ